MKEGARKGKERISCKGKDILNKLYSACSQITGTLYNAVETEAEIRRENGLRG